MASVPERVDVTVDGVRSVVLAGGPAASDTAVVFLHGNLGEGEDWVAFLAQVSAFARCVAPDLPGFGAADKPADFDYTSEGYGRYVGGLLQAMGIRRTHLVTHDLGGLWGLQWAAQHPDQLASLTLISIGALPGYRGHRFARAYRTPILGELTLATASRRAVRWAMQFGSTHVLPAEVIERARRSSRDPGTRRAVLRIYRGTPDLGAGSVRAAAALRDVNPPTLVIWGTGDPYVPVSYAQVQRKYFPQAQIVELAGCGHYPLFDDASSVSAALTPFLRQRFV